MDLKSKYEAIERLARLRDSGAITEAEFGQAKAKLLGGEDGGPEAVVPANPQPDFSHNPVPEPGDWTEISDGGFEPERNYKWFAAAAAFVLLLGGGYWFTQGSKAATATDVIADAQPGSGHASSAARPAALQPRLIGAWAPEGEYCSSGAGYTFDKSGEYFAEDESGRWSTAGDSLMLNDGKGTDRANFRFQEDGTLVTKWDRGSTVRWRKCKPESQNYEPWFTNGPNTTASLSASGAEADAALEAARAAVDNAAAAVEQASASATSDDWRGNKGRCRLVVDGRRFIDGQCWVRLEDDGSFQVMSLDEKYFAKLLRDGQEAEGHWNETAGSTHAQARLGAMTRTGACWSNGKAQICAWN